MRMRRPLLSATITAALAVVMSTAGAVHAVATPTRAADPTATFTARRLPLGPAGLAQHSTAEQVAPGVTHLRVEAGAASTREAWTVTVGTATTEAEATPIEAQVRAAGYEPRRDRTAGPSPLGPAHRPLGWMIRVGRYADQAAAQATVDDLKAKGLTGAGAQYTGEDGFPTTGPWVVNVLVIDPKKFDGTVRSELGTQIVPGRETTSSVSDRLGALGAVNGGFFVIANDPDAGPGAHLAGTEGDLGGISVLDGDLVSEAVNGRPALVLAGGSGKGSAVRRLATHSSIHSSDGATGLVTGLNRKAGLIVNCGGVGDETPFLHPAHDYTCGNPNEIVVFDPVFGPEAETPIEGEESGYQVTLDRHGVVTATAETRGGPIPADGKVVQGTGTGATWLREHAPVGAKLAVSSKVVDAVTGAKVRLGKDSSVVNGGPLLLHDGRIALDPVRDGYSPEDIDGVDRANFYNGWYLRRNPRTAAGVTADGRIVLMTVDGRKPGHSVGLSVPEVAAVMRILGARDAINLDGGGSTMMVVDGQPQVVPSDATGERPDGDAIVVLPRQ